MTARIRPKKIQPAATAPRLPSAGTYFASVALKNIRCFGPEQTLSLLDSRGVPARWTVLLGENGVGKTTLLQVLALLAVQDTGALEHQLEIESFEMSRGGPERRTRRRLPYAGSLSRGAEGRAVGTFRHDKEALRHEIRAGASGFLEGPQSLDRAPFLCGYGANRRLGEGALRRRRSWGADAFISLFSDTDLRDAEEWLLQTDYAAARDLDASRGQRKLDVVRELLLRVLPEASDVRIQHEDYPRVEVKTPYGWVHVRSLSLGYQTLVAWMVDLASRFLERFEGKDDPLAQPAIVLVDEIDLHLHPKWQRALMGFLGERFPATQFIATAHSPLVVQAAEDANIVVLRREDDHVVIESKAAEIRNWRIDQILTSDLYGLPSARPPQLDGLLKARRDLLTKPVLSAADERKLSQLEAEIGDLPGGETPEELRAMQLIERAAAEISRPTRKARR